MGTKKILKCTHSFFIICMSHILSKKCFCTKSSSHFLFHFSMNFKKYCLVGPSTHLPALFLTSPLTYYVPRPPPCSERDSPPASVSSRLAPLIPGLPHCPHSSGYQDWTTSKKSIKALRGCVLGPCVKGLRTLQSLTVSSITKAPK